MISTSEMLGKLPFLRGAERRKMKENEESERKRVEKNGGIVCKFYDRLKCHVFCGRGTVGTYLQPRIFATTSYKHLWQPR